jgi:hypothetical protein
VAGALALASPVSAQRQNLPDVRPLVTTVVGDAGVVVYGPVSALPAVAQGDANAAVEGALVGVGSGVFPIPFQLVGHAGPIVDPGPYPGNVPNATTDSDPPVVPGVTVKLLSRLGNAVALRRAVVQIAVSGPGRIALGGRLVRKTRSIALSNTAVSFTQAGVLRIAVALSPRARRLLKGARRARLDLGLVVGAPRSDSLAQSQRARLILSR